MLVSYNTAVPGRFCRQRSFRRTYMRPPESSDPRCRPHPIGTFLQAIQLTGRWREVPRKVFIGAHGWDGSPFLELFDRLKADPGWSTHSFDCGHNIARLRPEALVEVLLAQV